MSRIVALIILLLPGVLAVYGIKLMRDSLFDEFLAIFFNSTIQFIIGLLLFILGFVFIGGFIIYRDRKNNYRAISHTNKEDGNE